MKLVEENFSSQILTKWSPLEKWLQNYQGKGILFAYMGNNISANVVLIIISDIIVI